MSIQAKEGAMVPCTPIDEWLSPIQFLLMGVSSPQ